MFNTLRPMMDQPPVLTPHEAYWVGGAVFAGGVVLFILLLLIVRRLAKG